MERQDVELSINTNITNNTTRDITPEKVRIVLNKILDWLEFLELGGSVVDLDTIYRKITESYSKSEVDSIVSAIELTPGPAGPSPEVGVNGNWWLDGVDTGKPSKGADGEDGDVPEVGPNGNWWIDGVDTGDPSKGTDGEDGTSPHIGGNGNWWIGDEDTGVSAAGGITDLDFTMQSGYQLKITWDENGVPQEKTVNLATDLNNGMRSARHIDYAPTITPLPNGENRIFRGSFNFNADSIAVYRDGVRMSQGGIDYQVGEDGNGTYVDFVDPPPSDTALQFDYIKK